ncbi:glycosyltransferase family 2 protein [Olleya sp. Bg11-27]|uniref:glycosyltransferase family 2 protein n=1 Tax=Olleya sp. Bg11-27 TaxID=2058135 RepID=UPI000C31837B|nr:glycosyltransferase family A protein [Olleya sp. Bg11-27]AUC75828.1 glycosyltransferase family 2 protein [Olleya sp. Bg11-27]
MIILVHDNNKVVALLNAGLEPMDVSFDKHIATALIAVAKQFPETLIIWCHKAFVNSINTDLLHSIFHHKRILASYNPSELNYLPNQIGYVDREFYLKINKTVSYPTWVTSSNIGGVNSSVINSLVNQLNPKVSFDYFLISLAKRAMVNGLFCYSEPKLLKTNTSVLIETPKASTSDLFLFVKQHYKWVWVFFLSMCYFVYERKIVLFPLLKSLFFKRLSQDLNLEGVVVESTKSIIEKKTIDVIIPTIGRKEYLYDVLKDLASQTLLPKNVIIVEQNTLSGSVSDLHYLKTEDWPFTIKHTFTHQSGVVNARNIALSQVTSEWVLLGDDDNRFDQFLIEQLFSQILCYGVASGLTVYLQPHEKQTFFKTGQTPIFGGGNAIIKSSLLNTISFNPKYEFNYGEDTDFGMQIRLSGEDVAFFSDIKITHLKAPIGGYRTIVKQRWVDDIIQPKPSPTIQLLYQTYYTDQQLLSYKLLLGLRSYKHSAIKNPMTYIKHFNKQWQRSQFWSSKL